MSDRKIVCRIDPNGELSVVEVTGFGSACTQVTKAIEMIGDVDESTRQYTDEIHQEVENDQQLRIQAQ